MFVRIENGRTKNTSKIYTRVNNVLKIKIKILKNKYFGCVGSRFMHISQNII